MHPDAQRLQEMLQGLYSRHTGLVGFLDESYRSGRDREFPFYTVTATVLDIEDLNEFRDDYLRTVGGHRWHTTERYSRGEKEKIREFIALLDHHKSELVVSVQVDIDNDDVEHARRECLVQLVSRLSTMGCTMVVYERRGDNKVRNADSALFSKAARDGFVPRNIRIFAGSPSAEELLWGPDLAGWALRRYVAINDAAWILPLIGACEVIDVSLGMALTKKRPEPAAAMDSGPGPSVGLKDEGKERSSGDIIARNGSKEKALFEIFPKISDPVHDPSSLKTWLLREFPRIK